MRSLLLYLLLLSIPLTITAEEYAVLLCYHTNETVSFTVGNEPTAYVDNGDVVIRLHDVEVRYPISEGVVFKIVKQDGSKVDGIGAETTQFTIKDGTICCKGLQASETISLYSVNGTKFMMAKANDNGESTIDVRHLNSKVIIIKTRTKNFKIISR